MGFPIWNSRLSLLSAPSSARREIFPRSINAYLYQSIRGEVATVKIRYPLVNVYIANWKDPPFSMGNLTINHHFQYIAMLFYQMVLNYSSNQGLTKSSRSVCQAAKRTTNGYPLVMTNIAMENPLSKWRLMSLGTSSICMGHVYHGYVK